VEIIDGKITLRDELQNYTWRGEALEQYSYLDFMLNTYDSREKPSKATKAWGRPQNQRVAYQGQKNSTRVHILRSSQQETMPNFIGKWFPQCDEPGNREHYCALMLMLLRPWRNLGNLMGQSKTFDHEFSKFMQDNDDGEFTRFFDNVNYFYDTAERAREVAKVVEVHRAYTRHRAESDMDTDNESDNPPSRVLQEQDVDIA
jgi:hypothetical protein